MNHKIAVTTRESMDELVRAVECRLLRRGVQHKSGHIFTLRGGYVRDQVGTLSSILINLTKTYKAEDRDYLINLRAEIERCIAHYSSVQLSTAFTAGPGYGPVGFGLDYMSLVQPSGVTEHDALNFIDSTNCHHFANYLLRCVNGYNSLKQIGQLGSKTELYHVLPDLQAIPSPENMKAKVTIQATYYSGNTPFVTMTPAGIRDLLKETYYNSAFIEKVAHSYRYVVRKV